MGTIKTVLVCALLLGWPALAQQVPSSPEQTPLRPVEQSRRPDDPVQERQEPKKESEAKEESEAKKESEPAKDKGPPPKLDLPIRYFVLSAVFSGMGFLTGLISAGPERNLRDPSKHNSRLATDWMYFRAYSGGLVSRGFYALSGSVGGLGTYKLQGAIREYVVAKAKYEMADAAPPAWDRFHAEAVEEEAVPEVRPPSVRLGATLLPGGGGAALSFDF